MLFAVIFLQRGLPAIAGLLVSLGNVSGGNDLLIFMIVVKCPSEPERSVLNF